MITGYSYELWNGKKVIGHYWTMGRLRGRYLTVVEVSALKQKYYQKPKTIVVPIISRIIFDNGIDYTVRLCLDVRRKSNRQIAILVGKSPQ